MIPVTLDRTNGTITGSIDTGVSQGIYTVVVTGTAPSYTSSATTLSSTTVSAVYILNKLLLCYLTVLPVI
ncbi:putative Ig domain-containing protein [Tropheryma whipplei]|uniref:putative Ig domain-containing protein n=2 Tax=Tropheryma whipplei TaxID=2039 RepID=UPI0003151339|nr:putative Ig domain-containing protein [Tropheryma whipplei]